MVDIKKRFKKSETATDYSSSEMRIILIGRYILAITTVFWIGLIVALFIIKNPIL